MTTAEKVTVSLPAELLAHIEKRRHENDWSRSELVSDLLWRGWRHLENEEREERYRSAYQLHPDSPGEKAWADYAADSLLSANDAGWDSDEIPDDDETS